MALEGHISYWHIYGYSTVNSFWTFICSIWGLHVEYSIGAVGHTYMMFQAYLFRTYVSNVKCMYSSAPGLHCHL